MFDKVVIMSASPLLCEGVKLLLAPLMLEKDVLVEKKLVRAAHDFHLALKASIKSGDKSIVIVDSGLFALPRAKYFFSKASAQISSVLLHDELANEVISEKAASLGFNSCVEKAASQEQLCSAIRLLGEGKDLSLLTAHLPRKEIKRNKFWCIFTERENEVAHCLASGLMNKQIGYELGISEDTVKSHVSRILQKTNMETRTQFVVALHNGSIELSAAG